MSDWESNYVPGEGKPGGIMFVGEAPGKEEDREQRPFVGKSGVVLWSMVWRTLGLNREDVWTTNLWKYRPEPNPDGSDNPPNLWEIEMGTADLETEIAEVNPKVIVTLGRYAYAAITGVEADMMTVHGIPTAALPRFGERSVFPVMHPAAGIHSPDFLKYTAWDLERLARWYRGEKLPTGNPVTGRYRVLHGREEVEAVLHYNPHRNNGDPVAIDTEGTPADPFCLTFSLKGGEAFLIYADDPQARYAFDDWLKIVRPQLVFHNALWDWDVLNAMGITAAQDCPWTDTMEMAYLLQVEPKGLKALAYRYCSAQMKDYEDVVGPHVEEARRRFFESYYFTLLTQTDGHHAISTRTKTGKRRKRPVLTVCKCEACAMAAKLDKAFQNSETNWGKLGKRLGCEGNPTYPTPSLRFVPEGEVVEYACKDADMTLRLYPVLSQMIREMELDTALDLDLRCWPMVKAMQLTGMQPDLDKLEELGSEMRSRLAEVDEMIRNLADRGEDLNPGSAPQMAEVFFKRLGMAAKKMTRSGARESVSDDVVQALIKENPEEPILPLYSERVELAKLIGTYIDGIPGMVEKDGRIHPRLNTTQVVSGRYAHFLLTFPQRSDWGKRIRGCFVAPPGYVLGSWDLSQIELRATAHLSGDRNMVEAFIHGEDLHTKTARLVFAVPEPTKEQRYVAKTLNFAILYGISAEGLFAQFSMAKLPYTLADCQGFIDRWFDAYSGVRQLQEATYRSIRSRGFVREPQSGRIRYLPGACFTEHGWPFGNLRSGAYREGFSLIVQGFARTLLKEAAVRIWEKRLPKLWNMGWNVKPVLDIHDEMLFQVPDHDDAKHLTDVAIVDEMTRAKLKVPVLAEGAYAGNWGDLK